jgi:hypothetical protein
VPDPGDYVRRRESDNHRRACHWGALHLLRAPAKAFSQFDLPFVRKSFEFSALAISARIRRSMNGKITYTNDRIGDPKVIRDFLPLPEALAFRKEPVKITVKLRY